MDNAVTWPDGKKFAFTVFDDTDAAEVGNVKDVYALLRDCGLRTTKSVWPLKGKEEPLIVGGSTCADPEYLAWLKSLQESGFEIGFHNVTYHSSERAETQRGLDTFARLFGGNPKSMANHTLCEEGIYWGENRVTGIHRTIYNLLTRNRQKGWFRGHVEGDKYFWGDLCRERLQYVRNFVFSDINTLKSCPWMPYYDPLRPYVNGWYASSEGADVEPFNHTISEANQDRLEAEGGACIMYTHFAKGFYKDGKLEPRFKALIERLGKKNGWFVPVSTLLDYLVKARGRHTISNAERRTLERRWLLHKIMVGTT